LTATAVCHSLSGMTHRFHVKRIGTRDRVRLDAETVRHLHVLGLGEGSEVVLFDGTGGESYARIEEISRRAATARIVRRDEVSREPTLELTLACAPPKGRRMDTLVRMCAELGVRCIVPLIAQRSVVRPKNGKEPSHKLERWRKICLAASEQSGRTFAAVVEPPVRFPDILDRADAFDLAVLLSPEEDVPTLAALLDAHPDVTSLLLVVGPEGGVTEEESALAARHGVPSARLTPSILRVETACVAAVAVALTAAACGPSPARPQ